MQYVLYAHTRLKLWLFIVLFAYIYIEFIGSCVVVTCLHVSGPPPNPSHTLYTAMSAVVLCSVYAHF